MCVCVCVCVCVWGGGGRGGGGGGHKASKETAHQLRYGDALKPGSHAPVRASMCFRHQSDHSVPAPPARVAAVRPAALVWSPTVRPSSQLLRLVAAVRGPNPPSWHPCPSRGGPCDPAPAVNACQLLRPAILPGHRRHARCIAPSQMLACLAARGALNYVLALISCRIFSFFCLVELVSWTLSVRPVHVFWSSSDHPLMNLYSCMQQPSAILAVLSES